MQGLSDEFNRIGQVAVADPICNADFCMLEKKNSAPKLLLPKKKKKKKATLIGYILNFFTVLFFPNSYIVRANNVDIY